MVLSLQSTGQKCIDYPWRFNAYNIQEAFNKDIFPYIGR